MSLLTDLAEHWRLNESSGTRIGVHAAQNLTDNNTVTQTDGKIGKAALFASANSESLSRADSATLSLGADTPLTIAGWASAASVGSTMGLVSKWTTPASADVEYLVRVLSGQTVQFFVGNGTNAESIASTATISQDTPFFWVGWHDPEENTVNIQVNNGTPDSRSWSGGTQDAGATFYIGRAGSGYWDGWIDSVSIWKRVLTNAERSRLHNGGNGLDYSTFGQVNRWPASSAVHSTVNGATSSATGKINRG